VFEVFGNAEGMIFYKDAIERNRILFLNTSNRMEFVF
jgi:hypothetical protein